jgi:hypothetical protein
MAIQPRRQQIFTIACRCGAHAAVHVDTFNRPQTCRQCKESFTVTWKRDAGSGRLHPVVVAKAKTRVLPPPKPRPSPGSLLTLKCPCGYQRQASADEASRGHRCPGCGKWMIVEKPPAPKRQPAPLIQAPGSLAMPVPPEFKRVGSSAVPTPPAPFPAAPPPGIDCPCGAKIPMEEVMSSQGTCCPTCGRKVRMERVRHPQSTVMRLRPTFDVPAKPAPAPNPEEAAVFSSEVEEEIAPAAEAPVDPLAQTLICQCGQELLVSPDDLGHHVQCPGCNGLMQIAGARDPSSGDLTLRADMVDAHDQGPWSLDDFK